MRGNDAERGYAVLYTGNTDIADPLSALARQGTCWAAKEGEKMDSYRCKVCGYIYDPAEGDPDGGIAPGTPFDQIPDDWLCPVCGAPKSEFEKV